MFDAIVLGSGRSGTSMVTGALAKAGYFMGEGLFSPRVSNPKGFFEAPEVNGINEALLASAEAGTSTGLGTGQRWLATPERPIGTLPRELEARVRALVERRPFCFKDPRFSFTLPAWRPHLGAARFVCVFRDPALTAASLVEETRRAPYLAGVDFGRERAFALWQRQYEAVLDGHANDGEWLFLHYDQVLSQEGLERLGTFLEAPVDASFPDARLRREEAAHDAPEAARELYERLCERAGHRPGGRSGRDARPAVAVVAVVDDAARASVAELVEDVRGQRGVTAELVLVDATSAGDLACEGARVERSRGPSRGRAILAAAARSDAPLVAFAVPGARWLPSHLAAAAEALATRADAHAALADLYLCDEHGQFTARVSTTAMGDAPGAFFEAGLVVRRAALEQLDPRAFVPCELALHARLVRDGRVATVPEPGATVERARHEAAQARAEHDAALVALLSRLVAPRPELTVSICTYQRRETLAECLEAFARQLVPPGTFELVVVDDGATDGTREWLDALELAVPLRVVHQPNAGLAAARNAGLAVARGRYVLFANDDTIPLPDCVERHLRAHARIGAPACVLGTFEQPKEALDNALMSHLERSTEVFAYARLQAGQTYDGTHFWTCNVSAPLADVRAAGAFDESFRHYGCEDTDLGLRLEARGLRVCYEPRARALHRHVLSFDDLARRQRQVARAYVRLARKHPDVLVRWNNQALTGAWLAEHVAAAEPLMRPLTAAARELSAIDVGALAGLGEPHAKVAAAVSAQLAEALRVLDRVWWWQGYLDGLAEHRLSGFDELARGEGDHPFGAIGGGAARARRLLALPRWDDPRALATLMDLVRPAADFATLVLRFDPERDGDRDAALGALSEAYESRCNGVELDVLIEDATLSRTEWLRMGRSVDAVLVTGAEERAELALVAAERFACPETVAAWRTRFGAGESPSLHAVTAFAPRVELTVIVPTHDRPRELARLLARLAAQDLEPERFEVIVVDDGSAEPVAAALGTRGWPFRLSVLRQECAGPGAARNAALAHAEGDVVLFLNDDAVPMADLVRRHLLAHAHAATPRAVLGTFQLLREHVVDSLAWHIETTTALFAQSAMRAGVLYDGQAFCTGNLSVPRAVLARSSGFDASLPFAGGEDTEFGLRLAREQGLKVLYDPRIRCGHDHRIGLASLVRRHQVLGWVAHRIEERHPGAGMVPGWPIADADWRAWSDDEQRTAADAHALLTRIDRTLAAERRAGRGPVLKAQLREALDTLQDQAFRTGLLRAHTGLPALPTPHEALAVA